eukprot:gene1927-2189_t
MGWRLTRSTSHEEVKDLLENIKLRLDAKGIILDCINVDKCCGAGGESKFYKEIFGSDVPIKLDIFHAVQRIIRPVLTKYSIEKKQFGKEFGLIFRYDGDTDKTRKRETPPPSVILNNLDIFLQRWRNIFAKVEGGCWSQVCHEIEKLKKHIENGCLSGIQPGSGTTANQRLHRFLNRSLVAGSASIRPELPIEVSGIYLPSVDYVKKPDSFKTKDQSIDRPQNHASSTCIVQQNDSIATSAHELVQDSVLSRLLHKVLSVHTLLQNVNRVCIHRDYDVFNAPLTCVGNMNLFHLFGQEALYNDREINILKRNLAGFQLRLVPTPGNGDCAFRSIINQLYQLLSVVPNDINIAISDYWRSIGLGLVDAAADTYTLRQMFVNKIENDPNYDKFCSRGDRDKPLINEFRKSGFWQSNIGDLVVRERNVLAEKIQKMEILVSPASTMAPTQKCASATKYLVNSVASPHATLLMTANMDFIQKLCMDPQRAKRLLTRLLVVPFSGINIHSSFIDGLRFEKSFREAIAAAADFLPNYIILHKYCKEDMIGADENRELNDTIESIIGDLADQRSTMNYGRVLFFLQKLLQHVNAENVYKRAEQFILAKSIPWLQNLGRDEGTKDSEQDSPVFNLLEFATKNPEKVQHFFRCEVETRDCNCGSAIMFSLPSMIEAMGSEKSLKAKVKLAIKQHLGCLNKIDFMNILEKEFIDIDLIQIGEEQQELLSIPARTLENQSVEASSHSNPSDSFGNCSDGEDGNTDTATTTRTTAMSEATVAETTTTADPLESSLGKQTEKKKKKRLERLPPGSFIHEFSAAFKQTSTRQISGLAYGIQLNIKDFLKLCFGEEDIVDDNNDKEESSLSKKGEQCITAVGEFLVLFFQGEGEGVCVWCCEEQRNGGRGHDDDDDLTPTSMVATASVVFLTLSLLTALPMLPLPPPPLLLRERGGANMRKGPLSGKRRLVAYEEDDDDDDLSQLQATLSPRGNPIFGNMFVLTAGANVRVGVLLIDAMQQIVKFLVGNEEKFGLLEAIREPVKGERECGVIVQIQFQKALEAVRQGYEEKFNLRTMTLCHVCCLHSADQWCKRVNLRERQKRRLCLECFLMNNIEAGVINVTEGRVTLPEVCRTHVGYKLMCVKGMDVPAVMGRRGEAVCIPWRLLEHMMTCPSSGMHGLLQVYTEGLGRAYQYVERDD